MLDGKALGHAGSQFGGKIRIVGLDHDSQQGLRARRTDEHAAAALHLGAAGLDRAREVTVVLPVVAGRNALVDEYLRQKLQVGRQFGKAPAAAAHGGEHLKGAHDAVARRLAVERKNVARRFAAEKPAVALELLEHVAVATLARTKETPSSPKRRSRA